MNAPIFIGGTGRSGTNIMGALLNSHAEIYRVFPENKLIVENNGLRSLVHSLSDGYDFKANSDAIKAFENWALVLRRRGFHQKKFLRLFRYWKKFSRFRSSAPITQEEFCRRFPRAKYALHSIGDRIGLEHYDACLDRFLAKIVIHRDEHGVFDTEGIVAPILTPATNDRDQLLEFCREYLSDLYDPLLVSHGKTRWCDDAPLNVRYAPFLSELYPQCKIIHMARDPRDVFASYINQSWASKDARYTLERLKTSYIEQFKSEAELPQTSMKRISLERFTNNFDEELSCLAKFLNVSASGFDGSIQFEKNSFGRWQRELTREQIAHVEKELDFAISMIGVQ